MFLLWCQEGLQYYSYFCMPHSVRREYEEGKEKKKTTVDLFQHCRAENGNKGIPIWEEKCIFLPMAKENHIIELFTVIVVEESLGRNF